MRLASRCGSSPAASRFTSAFCLLSVFNSLWKASLGDRKPVARAGDGRRARLSQGERAVLGAQLQPAVHHARRGGGYGALGAV